MFISVSSFKLKVSLGFPISRWIIPKIGHLLSEPLPAIADDEEENSDGDNEYIGVGTHFW